MINHIKLELDGHTFEASTLPASKGLRLFKKLGALLGGGQGGQLEATNLGMAIFARMGESDIDELVIELCKDLRCDMRPVLFDSFFSGDDFGMLLPITVWLIKANFGSVFKGIAGLQNAGLLAMAPASTPDK